MVVRHFVLFKLKPGVTAEQTDRFLSVARTELAKVPYGKDTVIGPPLFDIRAGGYEYGLYREFKDVDEFLAYRVHPDHVKVINGVLAEVAESFISFQLQA